MRLFVERFANGGYAAIHHVAGRHHVSTGFGQADGRAGQLAERGVVIHNPALAGFDHHAAVTVAGVLAQADVGNQHQFFGGV